MRVDLTDESLEMLAERVADKLAANKCRVVKSESQKKLRNSRLILEHYRGAKDHISENMPVLGDDLPVSKDEGILYSLLGYRVRTEEFVQFIDGELKRYKQRCMAGAPEQRRRYEVINQLYLTPVPQTIDGLAERFHVDPKTIRRDRDRAADELRPSFFGVDGLDDMSK